eukprot:TRINITY_DN808_c0_g1_i1.p1 TRINITY_DN808_c0_g1~~TRINITY_DN808_c0_g1_i1.p1  ORF type:complete len:175 (-),score=38.20 TRINITY_DN808_c0_g1_i1:14-538(-)
MAVFSFDRFPGRTLHLFHFIDVENAGELVAKVRAGALEPPLALINADLLVSAFPVLAAAHKALGAEAAEQLKTRALHAELVFNVSASKHIREALLRWGITESSTHILAGRLDATDAEVSALRQLIRGTELDLAELEGFAQVDQIQKLYKIGPEELALSSLEDAVVGRIACRDSL